MCGIVVAAAAAATAVVVNFFLPPHSYSPYSECVDLCFHFKWRYVCIQIAVSSASHCFGYIDLRCWKKNNRQSIGDLKQKRRPIRAFPFLCETIQMENRMTFLLSSFLCIRVRITVCFFFRFLCVCRSDHNATIFLFSLNGIHYHR